MTITGSSPLNPRGAPLREADPSTAPVSSTECLSSSYALPEPGGQITALTFVDDDVIAVQEREPAAISFIDLPTAQLIARLELGLPSRSTPATPWSTGARPRD